MKPYVGVDVGSSYIKIIILDADKNVLANETEPMGISYSDISRQMLERILTKMGLTLNDVGFIVATGYGRKLLPFANLTITEIQCHAKGVHWLYPDTQMVIDIGGQDSKVILMDKMGHVINFVMNNKCAAGTGRFLEVMSRALQLSLPEMNSLALKVGNYAAISSVCTVFAESEVISMLASGYKVDEIVRGIFESVAQRIMGLAGRVIGSRTDIERIAMTGGAAQNVALVKSLERIMSKPILVPADPQMMGALGACLVAIEREPR